MVSGLRKTRENNEEIDVVVAGYTCVDLTPGFKRNETCTSIASLFKPGKLIEIEGLDVSLGGVVPNTGLALKKFGKKVFLNGLIGDDFIGIIAKKLFEGYGVSDGDTNHSKKRERLSASSLLLPEWTVFFWSRRDAIKYSTWTVSISMPSRKAVSSISDTLPC